MVGTADNPALKMKAQETWGFMMFLIDTIADYRGYIGDELTHELITSGRNLVRMVEIMRSSGSILAGNQLQERGGVSRPIV